MRHITALLVIWFVSVGSIARASESGDARQMASPRGWSTAVPGTGPLATAAAREVRVMVPAASPRGQAAQPPGQQRHWISRHPVKFGALLGAGIGFGASFVGGECTPVPGVTAYSTAGIGHFVLPVMGAAAGALAGVVVWIVR